MTAKISVESLIGLAILAGLLILVAPNLGPVWLLVTLYLVCWPARNEGWARRTMIGGTALLLFWAVAQLQVILTPFAMALVLAYVLDPTVRKLTRLKMPRTAAVVIVLLVATASVTLVVTVLIPPAVDGLSSILNGTSGTVESLWKQSYPWVERVVGERLNLNQDDYLKLADPAKRFVTGLVRGVSSFGRGVGAAGQSLALLLLTPVVLFYLLSDLDRIRGSFMSLLPNNHRLSVTQFLDELNDRIAAYFRGQATVSLTAGLFTGIGLDIAGVPHALSIGLATAAF